MLIRKGTKMVNRIIINQKNGTTTTWEHNQFTEYTYVDHTFIVINKGAWVGIYNMDCVDNIYIDFKEN